MTRRHAPDMEFCSNRDDIKLDPAESLLNISGTLHEVIPVPTHVQLILMRKDT